MAGAPSRRANTLGRVTRRRDTPRRGRLARCPSRSAVVAARRLRALAHVVVGAHRRGLPTRPPWLRRVGRPGLASSTSGSGASAPTSRRYVAHLTTRRYARRSIARKVAAFRRYFRWLRKPASSPSIRPSGSSRAVATDGCRGCCRTPTSTRCSTDRRPTTSRRGAAGATTPCSSCSTAAACGSASCARSTLDALDLDRGGRRRVGQGRQAASGAAVASRPSTRCGAWLRDRRRRGRRRPTTVMVRRCSATSVAVASRPATSGASSIGGRRRPRTPTPCATASPPICSTAAPTCGPCKSCSVTPTWPPRSATPTSARNGSAPRTRRASAGVRSLSTAQ